MSASRSPPPAESTATSHSAAIDTAARSSTRLVTTEPSSLHREPARVPVRAVDRAEVDAPPGSGSVGRTPDTVSPSPSAHPPGLRRARARPPAPCRHNRRHAVGRRPRALRAARPVVRPRRRRALARPGPALAALPRLTTSPRRRPRARRGDGNGPRRGRAPPTRVPRDRARPERGDARATPGSASANEVALVEASAEQLPFEDATFDHLTVTYLLRYVDDPGATLAELARVVRPGGAIASLEFGVPGGLARPAWELYVRAGLPLAGRALRNGLGRGR